MAKSKSVKPRAPRKPKPVADDLEIDNMVRLVDIEVEELNADPYETVEYFVDSHGNLAARAKR